jgi:hypothetical protein
MKIELNTKGLRKALPFLERLSEDIYGSVVNMHIGYDGQLRMEVKNPHALVEAAAQYGVDIMYSGTDKNRDYCYNVIAEVETAPSPAPSPVPPPGADAPSEVDSPDPKADAAEAAKAAEEREKELIKKINDGLAAAWPEQAEEFGAVVDDALENLKLKQQMRQAVGSKPPVINV